MLTINLIPEPIKKDLNQKIILSTVKNISGLFLAAIVFIGTILLWAKIVSVNNFNSAIEQATLISQDFGGINQEIRIINEKIAVAGQIQKNYILWNNVFNHLTPLIPADVTLNHLSMSEPGKFVTLKGTARTRESLIALETNLKSSPKFLQVEIPLKYFFEKENINFEINLVIKKDAFRQ